MQASFHLRFILFYPIRSAAFIKIYTTSYNDIIYCNGAVSFRHFHFSSSLYSL